MQERKCLYCGKEVEEGVPLSAAYTQGTEGPVCCCESCRLRAERFLKVVRKFRILFGALCIAGVLPFAASFAGMPVHRSLVGAGILLIAAVFAVYPFPRAGAMETAGIRMVRITGWIMSGILAILSVLFFTGVFGG